MVAFDGRCRVVRVNIMSAIGSGRGWIGGIAATQGRSWLPFLDRVHHKRAQQPEALSQRSVISI